MATTPQKRNMWPFVLMIGVLILAVIGYTFYWFTAASEIEKRVEAELDVYRAEGMDISHEGLSVIGFPYRFELNVDKPSVSSQHQGWQWDADALTVVMQTYKFNHLIAYAPGEHILTSPEGDTYLANVEGLQASYSWNADTFQRLSVISDKLDITESSGDTYTLEGAHIHASPLPEDINSLRIMSGVDKITLPSAPEGYEWLGKEVGPISAPWAVKNGLSLLETTLDTQTALRELKPELISPLTAITMGPVKAKLRTEKMGLDTLLRPAGVTEARLDNIDGLMEHMKEAGKLDVQTGLALGMAKGMLPKEDSFIPIVFSDGKVKVLSQEVADLAPVIRTN